ncbi:hypothetical protein GDO81_023923 [Engystomops pustulosus]|uniref:G-protein coupled receptors family 1 profile domain-containing protein n=1 Tax=Engystomops pustulosus TaxID=76066 RepID=A0AAV6ZTV6_ENGPU|nr:hypothetical protein GDO81_023923 [Engystomops pustulosus]
MENYTYEFFILTFPTHVNNKSNLSIVFVLLYMIAVIANAVTIIVIYNDQHLHTPMYLFLCNLAIIDIFYTTTTVPHLVHMLLSGDYTISFSQCFIQIYFFGFFASIEDLLLFIMAYDRYVAICHPLHYSNMLSKNKCLMFLTIAWVLGALNSSFATSVLAKIPMCYSNTASHFFCEFKTFEKISCPNVTFQLISYLEALTFGLGPLLGSIISYTKGIIVILHIKSSAGRRNAFSTCSSHLMVLTMTYGTFMTMYTIPPSKDTHVFELTLSVLYTTITPMLNPLIYSVRIKEVKRAILKLMGCRVKG